MIEINWKEIVHFWPDLTLVGSDSCDHVLYTSSPTVLYEHVCSQPIGCHPTSLFQTLKRRMVRVRPTDSFYSPRNWWPHKSCAISSFSDWFFVPLAKVFLTFVSHHIEYFSLTSVSRSGVHWWSACDGILNTSFLIFSASVKYWAMGSALNI